VNKNKKEKYNRTEPLPIEGILLILVSEIFKLIIESKEKVSRDRPRWP
jgi:hypothetical protein